MPQKRMECFRLLFDHLAWTEHEFLSGIREFAVEAYSPRPKKARQSKSTHKPLRISFFESTGMIYMHWVPTGQTVNKEYYVEVLREFRKRFRRRKRLALFKSCQWHLHQDNAPVHNSILVTDYLTKMGINTVPHPLYKSRSCSLWFLVIP